MPAVHGGVQMLAVLSLSLEEGALSSCCPGGRGWRAAESELDLLMPRSPA